MSLLLAALAPAVLLLIFIYRTDKYEPEPIKLLLKLYFLGMGSVIPILVVELILQQLNVFTMTGSDLENLYEALVVAGFTEELFKLIIVYLVVYKSIEYDEYLDGIIYCVFVSLGFATIENILYVIQGDMSVAILRAFLSVPGHMLFGVTMGYYLSLSKFNIELVGKQKFLGLALLIPMLLHGLYDYILMSHHGWLIIIFIPFMIWMWRFNMKKLKAYSKQSKLQHSYGNNE